MKDWLGPFNIELELNRTKLLFGVHTENSLSIKNYIILTVKYYIWRTKFQNTALSLKMYQDFLKDKLDDLKNACFFEGREIYFEPWLVIYTCLERICIGTRVAPPPPPTDPQSRTLTPPSPPGSPTGHPTVHPIGPGPPAAQPTGTPAAQHLGLPTTQPTAPAQP